MTKAPVRRKRDQLKQFRAFCAAARFENMTKAAEQLSVTQRAVSLLVRSLEDELEIELFERKGPRLRLTEAGRHLQALTQPLVDELDSLAETFDEKKSERVSAHIELAVAPVASVVLPSVVGRFHGAHPRACIRVTNCSVRDGLRRLADGRVDLVIGAGVGWTDFAYRPLFSYELMLVMSQEHPLAAQQDARVVEVGRYPAVVPTLGTYGRGFEDAVAGRLSIAGRVSVESSGWSAMKSFVRAGNGIAVMPSCCITDEDGVRAIGIADYPCRDTCGVFLRRVESLASPVIDFIDSLELESATRS